MFQVTCDYKFENGACVPTRVHTVVVSTQHSEKVIKWRKKIIKGVSDLKARLDYFEGYSIKMSSEF